MSDLQERAAAQLQLCGWCDAGILTNCTCPKEDPRSVIQDLLADLARVTGERDALRGRFDFLAHLERQREFSGRTFGPGPRTAGVIDHIRKELVEVEAAPTDLSEWIDVVILALDGAWRCGGTPEQIIETLVGKQARNEARTWPDWRTAEPGKAIEHDRSVS